MALHPLQEPINGSNAVAPTEYSEGSDDAFHAMVRELRAAGRLSPRDAPELAQFEAYDALGESAHAAVREKLYGAASRATTAGWDALSLSEDQARPKLPLVPHGQLRHSAAYVLRGLRLTSRGFAFTVAEEHSMRLPERARESARRMLADLVRIRGGSSFHARLSGRRVRRCGAMDTGDGTYEIECPLDADDWQHLHELNFDLRLDYTHYGAFADTPNMYDVYDHKKKVTAEPLLLPLASSCRLVVEPGSAFNVPPATARPLAAVLPRKCDARELLRAPSLWEAPARLEKVLPTSSGGARRAGGHEVGHGAALMWPRVDGYSYRKAGCLLRPVSETAQQCLLKGKVRTLPTGKAERTAFAEGHVLWAGSSHMRYSFDAVMYYADVDLSALGKKHADAKIDNAHSTYSGALYGYQVRWVLIRVLKELDEAEASRSTVPYRALVIQHGAWDVCFCSLHNMLVRQTVATLELIKRVAEHPGAKRAGLLVLPMSPTPYPNNVMPGQIGHRGGRNAHNAAAVHALWRAFLEHHNLTGVDSFEVAIDRVDFQSDPGGHFATPLRDEESNQVLGIVGPVGDAVVHWLSEALCAGRPAD